MSIDTIKSSIDSHHPVYLYEIYCWKKMFRDLHIKNDVLNEILKHPRIVYFKICRIEDEFCSYIDTMQDFNDEKPNDWLICHIDKPFSVLVPSQCKITKDGILYFISTEKLTPDDLLTQVEVSENFESKYNHEWFYTVAEI